MFSLVKFRSNLILQILNAHFFKYFLQAYLETPNAAKCNATGLTKGKYVFKLTVKDNLDNAAESSVEVVVNQDSNSAPVANAGADVLVSINYFSIFG